jgi:hypothetical protein
VVVDDQVANRLAAADDRAVRIFAASCAERLAQVFCAVRSTEPSRLADVEQLVESLDDLWNLDVPASTLDLHRGKVESFIELQPDELELYKVQDVYSFHAALALMYALKSASSGDPQVAVQCAHVLLTAMGQLDNNVQGALLFDGESERQKATLDSLDSGARTEEIRSADREIAQSLASVILGLVKAT